MTDLTTEVSESRPHSEGKHKDYLRALNQIDRDRLGHQIARVAAGRSIHPKAHFDPGIAQSAYRGDTRTEPAV